MFKVVIGYQSAASATSTIYKGVNYMVSGAYFVAIINLCSAYNNIAKLH